MRRETIESRVGDRPAREVGSRLRKYILVNGLKPGDRLPPEIELAAGLGVSRNTVRESLKDLEAIGAVERRPRRGTVLRDIDFRRTAEASRFLMLRNSKDLDELFETRRVLELGGIRLAAAKAGREDYIRMEKANRLMQSRIEEGGLGTEGDIAFHEALMSATGNKFLAQFGGIVQEFLREVHHTKRPKHDDPWLWLAEHREIARALRSRDTETAERIMTEHLDRNIAQGIVRSRALIRGERGRL